MMTKITSLWNRLDLSTKVLVGGILFYLSLYVLCDILEIFFNCRF